MKFLEFLDARSFGLQAAERRFEILKFLGARRFGLQAATGFLNLTPEPSRNGFRILKFTPEPLRNRFGILKFTHASAHLVDTAQNFILRNGFEILKFVPELSDGSEILKFTLAPHKFKPAFAVRLNFAFNSVPRARASKFENGVKFKGTAKFERGVR